MQTMREYAASKGLAKAGARGRLSREAHAAIQEAIANGMTFKDSPSVSPARSNSDSGDSESAAKSDSVDAKDFFGSTPEPFFPDGWHYYENGKRVNVPMSAACGQCGYSLGYQNCEKPTTISRRAEMVPVMR